MIVGHVKELFAYNPSQSLLSLIVAHVKELFAYNPSQSV